MEEKQESKELYTLVFTKNAQEDIDAHKKIGDKAILKKDS